MSIETLQQTEINFLTSALLKNPQQGAEELASHSLETKRIADPYYYSVNANGELISPTAHCRIKDVVQRTQSLGELEYQALLKTEQWVKSHNEGAIAWVSPPYPGVYPTSKIIISEIQMNGGVKTLFNRAIVLDYDGKKCFEFAQSLANYSQDRPLLSHFDEIRATPFVLNTRGLPWIRIFEELIDDPVLWQEVREGKDRKAKEEAVAQARVVYQGLTSIKLPLEEVRMMILGMLGERPGSCPPNVFKGTAFQVFSSNSLELGTSSLSGSDQYGSLEFECPKCNKINRRPRGELIPNCQHCNTDVSC